MLRAISRWAAKRSVPLRLTGVDMNPYAARLARECDRREKVAAKTISWVTGDVFQVELEQPVDVVVSSLVAHHLDDAAVVRLLRWKEERARVGWMVSDLVRSERAVMGYRWLTAAMGCCAMVKHDGVVSFRRAMTKEEWRGLVMEAGLTGVSVEGSSVGRLRVEKLR